MNYELKEEIIRFIKANDNEHAVLNLRQLFHVTKKQLTDMLKDERIETIRYGTGVLKFRYKRPVTPSATSNKMRGEWKPDTALQQALDRCRAERGGEFSVMAMSSSVKEYSNLEM